MNDVKRLLLKPGEGPDRVARGAGHEVPIHAAEQSRAIAQSLQRHRLRQAQSVDFNPRQMRFALEQQGIPDRSHEAAGLAGSGWGIVVVDQFREDH